MTTRQARKNSKQTFATWAQEQQTLFDSLAPSTMEKINSMVLAIDRDRRERLDQKIRLGVDFEDIQSFIESNLF